MDLSTRLAETKISLRQLAGPQVTMSFRTSDGPSRVALSPSRVEQLLGQIAVHARNTLSHGGHLTLETLSLDLDERGAIWHPRVPAGPWVLLVATEAVTPDWRVRQVHAPPSVLEEEPDTTLATIESLVTGAGGIFNADTTPGGGRRIKMYFPAERAARMRELKPAC